MGLTRGSMDSRNKSENDSLPLSSSGLTRRSMDQIKLDTRPVHMYTLTDEVKPVPLMKRVY